ncbi:hypothetical protein [Deinococcus indicus]|uniref:hypothetical protein n=1 Tax=Deinococcus indicus TaxID=223556 RepID=UPI00117736D7|nr:hypothetical protein [Deinococcus indicus]
MSEIIIGILLLSTPIILFLLTRKPGVTYEWKENGLFVRAGLSKYLFPYKSSQAALTHLPLGSRILGTAAPGTYVGQFAFSGVPQNKVHALANSKQPDQALIVFLDRKYYYLTPPQLAENFNRFE